MTPIELPAVSTGPGSQPDEEDGATLEYLAMPKGMETYIPPVYPEADRVSGLSRGIGLLRELLNLLNRHRAGGLPGAVNLQQLPQADQDMVIQALGEGEVSIVIAGSEPVRVQETRLAGVWRVTSSGVDGLSEQDRLEVGDVPGVVWDRTFRDAQRRLTLGEELPEGVLNARSVLSELDDHVVRWQAGDLAHVINLTLLPQSEQDLVYLDDMLGQGPVSMLSRGYGNCRVTATAVRNVWWVQHFNSDDRLILNSIEVVEVPSAVLAAQEDIEDSADRLAEILAALQ